MAYDDNNVFAKILRGELPCIRLYEDDHTLSFMDIMPQADGHVLIIPKEPAETLLELSAAGAEACMRTTQRMAKAVKAALQPPGLMVVQFNGAAAGQTVPHFHFHVIPRHEGLAMMAHGAKKADETVLHTLAEKIRAHIV